MESIVDENHELDLSSSVQIDFIDTIRSPLVPTIITMIRSVSIEWLSISSNIGCSLKDMLLIPRPESNVNRTKSFIYYLSNTQYKYNINIQLHYKTTHTHI